MKVVDGHRHRPQHLPLEVEVPQVRAGEAAAGGAVAPFVRRQGVVRVPGLLDRYRPGGGEHHSVSRVARRQDAVEQVHPPRDREEDVRGRSHPHQVARHGSGKDPDRPRPRLPPGLPSPPPPPPLTPPTANPWNGRAQISSTLRRRRSGNIPPWTIPNMPPPSKVRAARVRVAHNVVRRTASSTSSRPAGNETHSSSAMRTSEPSASCTATAISGVRVCADPSRWERNVTASSDTFRNALREKTWKPPLSVRIRRSHPMNRWRPPWPRIRSWPGRRYR